MLTVEGLKKSFSTPAGGVNTVVQVDNFELHEREQVVIQGASGSGKSTFLNCLIGLHKSDAGCIRYQDTLISEMAGSELDRLRASGIGFLRQRPLLFNQLSVQEHLGFARKVAGASNEDGLISNTAESIGLQQYLSYRPNQLSLGQQQRLAIGCVLMREPKLILADEPTAHLDQVATEAVVGLLLQMSEERSTALLMVTHDEQAAAKFSRRVDWAEINRVEL